MTKERDKWKKRLQNKSGAQFVRFYYNWLNNLHPDDVIDGATVAAIKNNGRSKFVNKYKNDPSVLKFNDDDSYVKKGKTYELSYRGDKIVIGGPKNGAVER